MRSVRGFTLIELMMVVAIVGILAAVAYPSYQDSVRKSKRRDAEGALMTARQAMERHYAKNFNYKKAATGGADTGYLGSGADNKLGVGEYVPLEGPQNATSANYRLKIEVTGNATYAYELHAVPLGDQAKDTCGTLKLRGNGQRLSGGANCWED